MFLLERLESQIATSPGLRAKALVDRAPDHVDPLRRRQERRLAGIGEDRHDDLVEHQERATEHVEVTVGDGVERAGIQRDLHRSWLSPSLSASSASAGSQA